MDEEEKNQGNSMGGSSNPMMWVVAVVIILLVLGGGYFFYKSTKNSTSSYQSQAVTPTEAMQVSPTASAMSSTQITISGSEFAFTPSTFTVTKGEKVEITFKNTGKYPHNLSITDLNVKTKTIQPGEQDVVSFVPDKTGTFSFMCTVPGHADRGMKGTLTVK